jgi:hypothetical protein
MPSTHEKNAPSIGSSASELRCGADDFVDQRSSDLAAVHYNEDAIRVLQLQAVDSPTLGFVAGLSGYADGHDRPVRSADAVDLVGNEFADGGEMAGVGLLGVGGFHRNYYSAAIVEVKDL